MSSLRKRYRDAIAVDGISLSIGAGEFVSLLGSSGSGKTTTLMIVAGFVKADAGSVRIGERVIDDLAPEERGLGVVFQSYALFPHLNVFENVSFPLRMRNRPRGEIRKRVEDALDLVELGALRDRRIGQISGGQQQRVALARALVYEPPVLLLDEPLGALDRKLRDQLQTEIKRIQRELGVTVMYVTHDQEEALSMSDRIAVMSHGCIEQVGTPDEVYEAPRSAFVAGFLGESNFIGAQVIAEGPPLVIRTETGHRELRGVFASGRATGRIRAMVRPEAAVVGKAAEGLANRVMGALELREHLGSLLRLSFRTEIGTIAARVPRRGAAAELRPGDRVPIGWRAEDLLVFAD